MKNINLSKPTTILELYQLLPNIPKEAIKQTN